MPEDTFDDLVSVAGAEWLEMWVAGPSNTPGHPLQVGEAAPDIDLLDHTGRLQALSDFWSETPALLMFWRHFGCSCGIERGVRLAQEFDQYTEAGLNPVIIGQGEPRRAAAYRERYRIPTPILCDPEFRAYQAFGLSHYTVEQVLYDAPEDYWAHSREIGEEFLSHRRQEGRPPVDDPWMGAGEFVIDTGGRVRHRHVYQYCEDYPDPRTHTTAARRAAG